MEANLPITFFSDLNHVQTESQRTGPFKCWDKHWRFRCRWCLVWIDPFSMRRHFEHSFKVTRKVCFLPTVNIKLPNYVKWNRHISSLPRQFLAFVFKHYYEISTLVTLKYFQRSSFPPANEVSVILSTGWLASQHASQVTWLGVCIQGGLHPGVDYLHQGGSAFRGGLGRPPGSAYWGLGRSRPIYMGYYGIWSKSGTHPTGMLSYCKCECGWAKTPTKHLQKCYFVFSLFTSVLSFLTTDEIYQFKTFLKYIDKVPILRYNYQCKGAK